MINNIYIGAFNWVSLRGARLLGRWRRVTVDLSRSHIHYQNTIPIGRGSDQSERLRQLPLSCDPLHRESLFAESASSHGADISGTIINCTINYSPINCHRKRDQIIIEEYHRFSLFSARNWWQNFSSNPTSAMTRNCLHPRSFVTEF